MPFPSGWITPDWPTPPNVRAVCTTRGGGHSTGAYASLNLGDHVGDDPRHVAANRATFEEALSAHPAYLGQVHGVEVTALSDATPDGMQADGCVTNRKGVACTIMVADCLPVLFATADGLAVGAAHAGWRSLAGGIEGGIVEAVMRRLLDVAAAPEASVMAWLGPCIGPEAFEVGSDVKQAFESQDPAASALFKPRSEGKWLADLPGLARRRLAALGITRIHGNDGGREWCTVSNPSRFFSHRRDGVSGRLAASIWID